MSSFKAKRRSFARRMQPYSVPSRTQKPIHIRGNRKSPSPVDSESSTPCSRLYSIDENAPILRASPAESQCSTPSTPFGGSSGTDTTDSTLSTDYETPALGVTNRMGKTIRANHFRSTPIEKNNKRDRDEGIRQLHFQQVTDVMKRRRRDMLHDVSPNMMKMKQPRGNVLRQSIAVSPCPYNMNKMKSSLGFGSPDPSNVNHSGAFLQTPFKEIPAGNGGALPSNLNESGIFIQTPVTKNSPKLRRCFDNGEFKTFGGQSQNFRTGGFSTMATNAMTTNAMNLRSPVGGIDNFWNPSAKNGLTRVNRTRKKKKKKPME